MGIVLIVSIVLIVFIGIVICNGSVATDERSIPKLAVSKGGNSSNIES